MFLVPFVIPYALIYYINIRAHITCVVHDLGALGVVQKI